VTGDCVLVGKILTLDGSRPEADAVAIQDGRITYIGAVREARRNAGPRAEVIDRAGTVALPGFIESHSHPVLLGWYLEEVDCRSCSSIEEIVEAYRGAESQRPQKLDLPSTSEEAVND
jgi:predicted amidohydrolase YtcJ